MTIKITVIEDGPGDVGYVVFSESLHAEPAQMRSSGYPTMAEVARVVARLGNPLDILLDAQERLRAMAKQELDKPGHDAAKEAKRVMIHAARKKE
jgi:hypothetical protein